MPGPARIAVVEGGGRPPVLRDLSNGIPLLEEELPEVAGTADSSWEPATDAHDGNALVRGRQGIDGGAMNRIHRITSYESRCSTSGGRSPRGDGFSGRLGMA